MTITHGTTTAEAVLDAVHALGPMIAERAPEIEAARRLPADLLDDLRRAGCFRLLRPTSHGGLGASLADASRVFEALARADASVGWTVMIGAGSWLDLVGLPRETFDALFATAPDAITAGVFNPTGSSEPVPGGHRVTGRWGFASGCEHADWLFGNCVEGFVDGVAQLRTAVFAPADVVVEDTWSVAGLRGTGSHHFRVDGIVVPRERTCSPLHDEPCIDDVIARVPPPSALSLVLAGVALGIAQGAIDDIVPLAAEKVPMLSASALAGNPVFQVDLATAATRLDAARGLVYQHLATLWAAAEADTPLSLDERARVRAAGIWSVEQAAAVVAAAYRAGGGSSLYASCPLQRRLRDVNALTQHFLLRRDALVTAGAILAGNDVDVPVF